MSLILTRTIIDHITKNSLALQDVPHYYGRFNLINRINLNFSKIHLNFIYSQDKVNRVCELFTHRIR